jgi:hypothetical protein
MFKSSEEVKICARDYIITILKDGKQMKLLLPLSKTIKNSKEIFGL